MANRMTRREFGRAAGLVVGSGVLSPSGLREAALGQANGSRVREVGRVSVMLWTLQGSFRERLETAAAAGYRRVELVEEFRAWTEAEWTAALAQMKELGLAVDAMAGVKAAGFAQPGAGEVYVRELEALLPAAHRLGCGQVILLSGPVKEGAAAGAQFRAAVETLSEAAKVLERAGLVGVIEPIDRLEQPTIYLDGVAEAFRMTREVGSAHMKVLYDLYHEQRSQGNLLEKLEKNIEEVGLIHVADVPGRHEPGTGEVNYGNVYRTLRRLGYRGMVAMEFNATGEAVETLRRAREEAEALLG